MPTIQFKRRNTGLSESPTGLKSGEPAYDAIGEILYLGHGDDGSGNAFTSNPIGGKGAFVDFLTAQTIGGVKTFTQIPHSPTPPGGTNDTSIVNAIFLLNVLTNYATLSSPIFTDIPTAPTADPGTNTLQIANAAFVATALGLKANTHNPILTGVAEAPTPPANDSSGRIATTDYVQAEILTKANSLDAVLSGIPVAPTPAPGTNNTEIATTAFVELRVSAAQAGLDLKASCFVATTENISLSGLPTIDDIAVPTDVRVLVKVNTDATENGIWITNSGSWTRAPDADEDSEVTTGLFTYIEQGTINGKTPWVLITPDPIVVGTTALEFSQYGASGAGGFSEGPGINIGGGTIEINGFGVIAEGALLKKSGTSIVAAVATTDYLTGSSTIDGGIF